MVTTTAPRRTHRASDPLAGTRRMIRVFLWISVGNAILTAFLFFTGKQYDWAVYACGIWAMLAVSHQLALWAGVASVHYERRKAAR